LGLLFQQAQAQAGAVDRIGVLPALQGVPRPPPGKAPLYEALCVKVLHLRFGLAERRLN
jgi:hypothetical protein